MPRSEGLSSETVGTGSAIDMDQPAVDAPCFRQNRAHRSFDALYFRPKYVRWTVDAPHFSRKHVRWPVDAPHSSRKHVRWTVRAPHFLQNNAGENDRRTLN